MIDLSHITLTYPDGGEGRLVAVDDVDLSIAGGETVGISGPSGSGKSSLLAVASTLVLPDRGSVRIGDVEATTLDLRGRARLRRERIGIVFQQANLLPSLTTLEQLLVMGELTVGRRRRRSRIDTRIRAVELLEAVGLDGHLDSLPAELSGGQRQRVNVARALMNEPALLVVDEPTSALDRQRGAQLVELVVELTRQYRTATMLVTHDPGVMARMDTTYWMVDGRLAPTRDPSGPNDRDDHAPIERTRTG
ncbi:ATP-binding cassette domain-containing protein [Nocardioides sp. LMS-CY]|uniref:Putative ABC transport system ATP-binding protein n=1 Tax=Nocardioides soli TaxID=1036020 RepID=A0A7W4VWT9_9ACTN|nr:MULTISPECIES: ATP-binding cassette domain-containing protein [Nocardioides]MBB3043238.1 putative ABC transport system ATP-binding protein [Nocardioides soli]QWF23265.1 ATP-binding cassette domain-containing protein [Nocardioides sp. LMS-CY]